MNPKYCLYYYDPDDGRPTMVMNSECDTLSEAETFRQDRLANGQAFDGEFVVMLVTSE
jgi:hypothetical protein